MNEVDQIAKITETGQKHLRLPVETANFELLINNCTSMTKRLNRLNLTDAQACAEKHPCAHRIGLSSTRRTHRAASRKVLQSIARSVIFLLAISLLGFIFQNTAAAGDISSLTNTPGLSDVTKTVYNDKNGLLTNEVNVVLQTADGYIWIGGYGGLLRYDGRDFRNFSMEKDGLPSFNIRTIFEDSKKRLWIGTNDKGVFLCEKGEVKQIPCDFSSYKNHSSVRCFAEKQDGTIYIGTVSGLLKISDGDKGMQQTDIPILGKQTVYTISVDGNGVLWGITTGGILFAVRDSELLYRIKPGELTQDENTALMTDGTDIYVGTSGNNLVHLKLSDDRYSNASFSKSIYDTGKISNITSLSNAKNGNIFIGSEFGGGWFDKTMKLHILPDLGEKPLLSSITEDHEGNIWVSSARYGVFMFSKGKFFRADSYKNRKNSVVNAVEQIDGKLYIAEDDGLTIFDDSFKKTVNKLTELLKGTRIRHLMTDSQNRLWISTYGNMGLLCYYPSSGKIENFNTKNGLINNRVRCTLELKNKDIAAATISGISILRDGAVVKNYGAEQGLTNPIILCLYQAEDGSLLAGSDGSSLFSISGDVINNYGEKEGLTAGVVLRMTGDAESGGIWVSAGSGLYFGDGSRFREIKNLDAGYGNIFDIKVCGDNILLLKSGGMTVVDRRELFSDKDNMKAAKYGSDEGLPGNITSLSWSLLKDDVFYIPTGEGLAIFDIKDILRNRAPSKSSVNRIVVDDEYDERTIYEYPSELSIPKTANRITIHMACLSFRDSSCQIEYFMEGFDNRKYRVSLKDVNTVSYTNLRGGEYKFHMRAINSEGVQEDKETIVSINKELKFYERRVFLPLCALLLALLIKLILDAKTRGILKRQQEYRNITNQALQTIANTIDAKDSYTKGHSVRVAEYSREIARRMGVSHDELENIYYIGLLHDIGKIGIPDNILNKPGKLNDTEYETIKNHTGIGGHILSGFSALPGIDEGAIAHHERIDGKGYPRGIKGEEISKTARIICVADCYDAMASKRAYRDPLSTDYITSEFQKLKGVHFDPEIAAIMIGMIEDGKADEISRLSPPSHM